VTIYRRGAIWHERITRWGEQPQSRPVHFREVFATLYERLGIDVAKTQFTDLAGRPQYRVGEHSLAAGTDWIAADQPKRLVLEQ
jgi:hypothetical protein